MTNSFILGGMPVTLGLLETSATAYFDPSNMSAFGTLETAELTPVFQGDFVYGINTQMWQTPVVSGTGAAVDTDASRLRIQSGTDANGYAYILSRRPLRYRAGQGQIIRITPLFTTGSANNVQSWGAGAIVNNAIYDGYFFEMRGTELGIAHYNRGEVNFTAQSSWNGDHLDGGAGSAFTLNPELGWPAMIKYPYLGYGDIEFFVQNPSTGRWVLAHVIRYANSTTSTQLSNPTLYIVGHTVNSGNTSNKIMYCGSIGAFISGVRSFIGNPKWAADGNKSGVTNEVNLLTLKNAATYNGVPNRGMIRVASMSISSSAVNGIAQFRLKINSTLNGANFTAVNGTLSGAGGTITGGNSVASYDTTGTITAGGAYIEGFVVDSPNTSIIDMIPYNVYVSPGETLTVSAVCTASSTVATAINWTEDI